MFNAYIGVNLSVVSDLPFDKEPICNNPSSVRRISTNTFPRRGIYGVYFLKTQ